MSAHLGFRVTATAPNARDPQVENFEVRQAAIDYAQLMDSKGWTHIQCHLVTSRVKQFDFDESEALVEVEWQCHLIGGSA